MDAKKSFFWITKFSQVSLFNPFIILFRIGKCLGYLFEKLLLKSLYGKILFVKLVVIFINDWIEMKLAVYDV